MNINDAFHSTVHSAPGGCEALAVRLGMSPVILRNKANPTSTTNKPMIDDIDRIMGLTGDHQFLHALAANHGFVCVKMEESDTVCDMEVLDAMAKVWSKNGEAGMEVHRALADGHVDARELVRIEKAAYETVRAMLELVGRLKGMVQR